MECVCFHPYYSSKIPQHFWLTPLAFTYPSLLSSWTVAPCEEACDKCHALTFWHIYIDGSRGTAASSLPSSSECTRPSGRVPGRLMDGARPLSPTELYLSLTSRCCHHCSTRNTCLINLSPPLASICLLHLSLHSPSSISLSLSSCASYGQSLSILLQPHLSQQASLFTPMDKQGGDKTPVKIHTCRHKQTHTI